MDEIREQIVGLRRFAELHLAGTRHTVCGIKAEQAADTMEELLAVYEAAQRIEVMARAGALAQHDIDPLIQIVREMDSDQTKELNDD